MGEGSEFFVTFLGVEGSTKVLVRLEDRKKIVNHMKI